MTGAPTILDEIKAMIWSRDHVVCPQCRSAIDMTDGERLQGHVTYWGEDEPVAIDCPHCEVTIYLQEHVARHWTAGRTPEEASEI